MDPPTEGTTNPEAVTDQATNVEDLGVQASLESPKPADSTTPSEHGESPKASQSESSEPLSPEAVLLKQQLAEMSPLYLPREFQMLPDTFDAGLFPRTYRRNTDREVRLLMYADNFQRQYAHLFRDRTRLFLAPKNECNVRKFVCTTIRPTKLPYPELYDWSGIASFVADFLDFCPLVPSTELPSRLLSPSTTLSLQRGTCFEYSTLLCSLLIGVGYDAYVVCGYATRECCYKDESRSQCPLLFEIPKPVKMYEEVQPKKYQVKPAKDFFSKYDLSVQVKKLMDEKNEALEKAEADRQELEKKEEPLPDPLYGLRVHCWVLVRPGRRNIDEAFFIEPLTGLEVDIDTKMYLGVESVWNNVNYWANMQDCSNGIQEMRYDLTDLDDWEYVLASGTLQELLMPEGENLTNIMTKPLKVGETLAGFEVGLDYGFKGKDEDVASKQGYHGGPDREHPKPKADLMDKLLLINLPISWTKPITLSQAQYDRRFANQRKEIVYNRARLIKYSPYSRANGLVTHLTVYSDREMQDPIEEREYFENRLDKLLMRTTNLKTSWVVEKFDHGRMDYQLKEHGFHANKATPDSTRYMEFYDKLRTDGLVKRERKGNVMKEWYNNRQDRLIYRETQFGRTVKKFGPPVIPKSGSQGNFDATKVTKQSYVKIDVITERFARNPNLPADEDVEERVFNIIGGKYLLSYHIADTNIFPCTREFLKPTDTGDRRQNIELYSDTHTAFHPTPNPPKKTNVEIYQMLLQLMDLEKVAKERCRASESEVVAILKKRTAEEANPGLEVGLWDTLRNEDMHNLRVALEKYAEQERNRQKEKDLDYLGPYFHMRNTDGENLSREEAFAIREACLQDLKDRLTKRAHIIQSRFEMETEALQKKQQWFQLNQINLTKDDEDAYLQYCNDAIFKITTLEAMLMKHKQTAPQKYMQLEKQLRSDPRLSTFLRTN
ncbi:unnamed protein product [Mesocestoides corti]|uniref:Dynein regulatory complex subunit 7 n=1 Tax=Mesocestoides corti TaxID=53468 RepID=A0A0R3UQK4_MESCO|nr:unnamed protein product [Mesocestoides corti]